MARLAVLASGAGSNFQALVETLKAQRDGDMPHHQCVLLVHDRKDALVADRARRLGVPSVWLGYQGRSRDEVEAGLDGLLRAASVDLVALAGFMRMLGPFFVGAWRARLVNIHPSILPAWPGSHAIERAFASGEEIFGASAHFVDEGMDSGPLIAHDEFRKKSGESLEELEARVHALEHRLYPRVVLDLLDAIETAGR